MNQTDKTTSKIADSITRIFLVLVPILAISLIAYTVFLDSLTHINKNKEIKEELNSPAEVLEVTSTGFKLSDGRLILPKFIEKIPKDSQAVRDAIKYGIEIDEHGQCFGLIKVHHWCGNDPVSQHLARINLSFLIISEGGIASKDLHSHLFSPNQKIEKISYSEYGMAIEDFIQFRYYLFVGL